MKKFDKPIFTIISHSQFFAFRIGQSVFNKGVNNAFFGKNYYYLSFLKYTDTPFNKDRPRSKSELLEIFSRLIYLPQVSKTFGDGRTRCHRRLCCCTLWKTVTHCWPLKSRVSRRKSSGTRKEKSANWEAGPTTCCCGLLYENCRAIFLIFAYILVVLAAWGDIDAQRI